MLNDLIIALKSQISALNIKVYTEQIAQNYITPCVYLEAENITTNTMRMPQFTQNTAVNFIFYPDENDANAKKTLYEAYDNIFSAIRYAKFNNLVVEALDISAEFNKNLIIRANYSIICTTINPN